MKLPASYYNFISYVGSAIAGISFLLILFMVILTSFIEETNPYLGILLLLIFPTILLMGLVLIPIGMWIKSKKAKRTHISLKDSKFILDLNIKRHRNATIVFMVGTFFFLFFTGIGSYELYHFSESVEFCGTVCHEVMKPEYVAYQNSPHAKVTCGQCHIGSGAEWFVKAKISGMYQVYSVLANKFPTPIPTPIENLRPARETCEQCHWPQKFYSNSLNCEKYYLTDEENTEWEIHLKMNTGSSNGVSGLDDGIHWHINSNIQIDYIATDKKREIIPWVRYVNLETGDTVIYNSQEEQLTEEARDTLHLRTMDCMDCHNRPAHNYLTPATFVNNAMASGKVSKELPEIKLLAMELFAMEFNNTDTALLTIENNVWNFYKDNYPEIADSMKQTITNSIAGLQKSYSLNMFPEMKANWDAYPDHIGHMEFNGCFRCHNDQHMAENGKVISKDCNLCHSILVQGTGSEKEYATLQDTLEFRHPIDIDEMWKESLCSDCHRYLY